MTPTDDALQIPPPAPTPGTGGPSANPAVGAEVQELVERRFRAVEAAARAHAEEAKNQSLRLLTVAGLLFVVGAGLGLWAMLRGASAGRGGTSGAVATPWIEMPLAEGWIAYHKDAEDTYNPPGFARDADGTVRLRGMLRMSGGHDLPVPKNSLVTTLPEGFRPAQHEILTGMTFPNATARIDILATGELQVRKGSILWVSLDGITFRASTATKNE